MSVDSRAAESPQFVPEREYLDLRAVGKPPAGILGVDYEEWEDERTHIYLDLETGFVIGNREAYENNLSFQALLDYEAGMD